MTCGSIPLRRKPSSRSRTDSWPAQITTLSTSSTQPSDRSGPSSVEQTVNQLKADGYTVMINKVGAAPVHQCTVAAVRPGQTYSRTDSGTPRAQDDSHTTVTGKSVFVDIAC